MRLVRTYSIIEVQLSKHHAPTLVLTRPVRGSREGSTIRSFTKEAMQRHGITVPASRLVGKQLQTVFRSKKLPHLNLYKGSEIRSLNEEALAPDDLCVFELKKSELRWTRGRQHNNPPSCELHLSSCYVADTHGFIADSPSPWHTFHLDLTVEEYNEVLELSVEHGFSVRLSLV